MSNTLAKSLVDLIDETLAELDELKKSDRFSAAEIQMGDSESGMKGASKNGKLGKEEDESEEDEEDEEEAKKAEGKNDEADMSKEEDSMSEDSMSKDEDGEEEEEDEEEKAKKGKDCEDPKPMKKSEPELDSLMKSYMDERLNPLEKKINSLFELVQEIADAPVSSKSASYKDIKPLQKSEPEVQPLAKSDVVNKLFDLKKSGEKVDTLDIASAELAGPSELAKIASKYGLK